MPDPCTCLQRVKLLEGRENGKKESVKVTIACMLVDARGCHCLVVNGNLLPKFLHLFFRCFLEEGQSFRAQSLPQPFPTV